MHHVSLVICWAGPQARRAEPVQAQAQVGPDKGLQWAWAWLQILEA